MHGISIRRLREFWESHPAAEGPLRRWYKVVERARWNTFAESRGTLPHADSVRVASGTTMTVFNVGGNNLRVVARVLFDFGRVHVRMVLTHAQYSTQRWKERL